MINGDVHIYDANGSYVVCTTLQFSYINISICLHCFSKQNSVSIKSLEDNISPVVSIDWYDGRNGFISPDSPALAICHENGRCQIMAHETDESEFFFGLFCVRRSSIQIILWLAGSVSTNLDKQKLTLIIIFVNFVFLKNQF
jgi:hypothetical protein